jgi:hypothetical protein
LHYEHHIPSNTFIKNWLNFTVAESLDRDLSRRMTELMGYLLGQIL